MSAIIQTYICCDGTSPCICGETVGKFDLDLPASTHRETAKERGWHRVRGKDYCPGCWKALPRPKYGPQRKKK